MLGVSCNQILVCSFGIVSPTKLNHLIARAADFAYRKGAKELVLAFVGDAPGNYGQALRRHARNAPYEFRITGRIPRDVYEDYLAAADIAVQLRGSTKGESSRAILDTMSSGIPTITNPVGSMAEFPEDCTYAIPEHPNQRQLGNALLALRNDKDYRFRLGERARGYVEERHSALNVSTRLEEVFASKSDADYRESEPTALCIDATELVQIADPEIRSTVFKGVVHHHQGTDAARRGIIFGSRALEGTSREIIPLTTNGEIISKKEFCRPRRARSMISWLPSPRQPPRDKVTMLTITSPEDHQAIDQAIRALSLNIDLVRLHLTGKDEREQRYSYCINLAEREKTILVSSSAALTVAYLIEIHRGHTGVIFCEDTPPLRHFFGSRAVYAPANTSFAASCTMLMLRSQLGFTA